MANRKKIKRHTVINCKLATKFTKFVGKQKTNRGD